MTSTRAVFHTSGTGQIGTRELEKALRLMQENITTDKIERLFAEADTDGSGWIEYDEFKAVCVIT